MNLYKREIYKKSLQHAERRNHKYLYKIGDRYIYPEDVAGKAKSTASNIGSMASAAGTTAKTKISNTIADQKTKFKDKKYLWDEQHRKYPNLEKANVTSPGGKRVNQITSAHQEGTKKTTALSYQSTHDPISNKVVKVKRDFDKDGNQIGVGYSTEPSHLAKKKHKISGIANSNQIEDRKRLEEQKRKEKKVINDKYGSLALNGAALDRGEKSFQERRYAIAQEYDHQKRSEDAKKRQEQKKRNISSSRKITNAHQVATKNARDFYPKDAQDSRGIDVMNRVNPVPKSIDKKRTAEATKKRTENGVEAGRKRAFKRPGNQTRIDLNPGVNKAREKRWSRENHEVYEDYGAGSRYDKEANQINSAHRGSTSIEARTLDNNRRRGYGLRRFKRRITH